MDEHTPTLVAAMPGPWQSENPGTAIILVSDEQFLDLAEHPDKPVKQIHPHATEPVSLREHCRQSAARGATQMRIAYDYFFGGSTRSLYPDSETFQAALKKVHDVAAEYGLGLEPSILSPLELGYGYQARTGESGRWMQYREGLRDPSTGQYSVSMWRHRRWCNNKGPTPIKLIGARAFAYHEEYLPGTPFFAVDPASIVELGPPALEEMPGAYARIPMLDGGEAREDAQGQAPPQAAFVGLGAAGVARDQHGRAGTREIREQVGR